MYKWVCYNLCKWFWNGGSFNWTDVRKKKRNLLYYLDSPYPCLVKFWWFWKIWGAYSPSRQCCCFKFWKTGCYMNLTVLGCLVCTLSFSLILMSYLDGSNCEDCREYDIPGTVFLKTNIKMLLKPHFNCFCKFYKTLLSSETSMIPFLPQSRSY